MNEFSIEEIVEFALIRRNRADAKASPARHTSAQGVDR